MQRSPAKKAKIKIKRRVKTPKPKHPQYKPIESSPPFPQLPLFLQSFNILPNAYFHPRISHLLIFCSASLKQQFAYIEMKKKQPFPLDFTQDPDLNTALWSPSFAPLLEDALAKIRKARAAFKKILHIWRTHHLTCSNTEDIVTLHPPKNPVFIIDWTIRAKYVFEASTIARDIRERLMCHDGIWEDSQPPRNPFTNLPLTLIQNISVNQQLALYPVNLGWTVLAFRQVRYDMPRFILEYTKPLHLHAYRITMRDTSHIDYKERMIDFIEYAYDQKSTNCLITTYSYCINNFPTNPIMKAWGDLCFKFYEASILYANIPEKLHTSQSSIISQTAPLLQKQEELREIRMAYLRLQRLASLSP
jgi:hypothetical protein